MDKKDWRGWERTALFVVAVLSGLMIFPRAVQAQEDIGAGNDPYLVDNFEGYEGEDAGLSRVWATGGEENCWYTISLTTEQIYEGEYAMKMVYGQTESGWGGCEIAKATDWSGCNALQLWITPDDQGQRVVVQINTAADGSYEVNLLDYPEYAEADTPLLVTIPFRSFVNPVSGKTLTKETASEIYSIGLWVSAMPDAGDFNQDGYVEGTLYFDGVRALNAVNLEKPVLERWSEGRFLGENVPESDTAENETDERMVTVLVVSGVIFIIAFICFVAAVLAGKRKRGVNGDGNSEN